MIAPPAGVQIWLVAGATDMRRGFDGLGRRHRAAPQPGPVRRRAVHLPGRRGHLVKILFWDGQGLVLYAKRLERGHFVWPATRDGAVSLTPAQLSMLTEGIDWRMPARTTEGRLAQPERAG